MAENVQSNVQLKPGETEDQRLAELIVAPGTRAAFLHYALSRKLFGPRAGHADQRASFDGMLAEIEKQQAATGSGDMRRASDLLVTQAHILDALFGDLMHRAIENMGEYPEAMQRYMGLALKAQTQSRTTIEALARMHQPREQVVRHVHVYEGGQAVVAEQLHMNGPGVRNAGTDDQSHTARTGDIGECASLPSPDPLRNGVPIPGGAGKAEMPDARRDKSRRAPRKPKRA
jgi:hypothetical protein